MPTNEDPNTPLILRDKLAIDRTRMANQRTLLAYARTGLFLIATALGIAHLEEKGGNFGWLEWLLTIIGSTIVIFGIVNYLVLRRKVRRQERGE